MHLSRHLTGCENGRFDREVERERPLRRKGPREANIEV